MRATNTYPVFTTGLHACLALAAHTVTRSSTANSAKVSRTMAARPIITGGHGHCQQRGDQEDELHFDGLRELVKVL